MKKLIVTLIVTIITALMYFISSNNEISHLTAETVVTGKDSEMAEKFTRYIYKCAQKERATQFEQRFRSIPSENVNTVRAILLSIKKMGKPIKVTVPATGKNRRYIYYRKDNSGFYKFVVNNSKNKWIFQELVEVKK